MPKIRQQVSTEPGRQSRPPLQLLGFETRVSQSGNSVKRCRTRISMALVLCNILPLLCVRGSSYRRFLEGRPGSRSPGPVRRNMYQHPSLLKTGLQDKILLRGRNYFHVLPGEPPSAPDSLWGWCPVAACVGSCHDHEPQVPFFCCCWNLSL